MGSPTSWLRLYTLNYGWRAAAHKCGQEHRGTPEWFVATVRDLMPKLPAVDDYIYDLRPPIDYLAGTYGGKRLTFTAQQPKTQE